MVQPQYSPQESLERVKLMMKYDTSKTLNENKKSIKEQSPIPIIKTQLPTWTNYYPCLLQNNLGTLKKTSSDNVVEIVFGNDGDKIFFWLNDQRCMIEYSNGTKLMGDWSCKDSNYVLKTPSSLYIQFDNGDVYDGDKFVKADDAQNTKVIEKLKTDNTSRQSTYTKCPETLPIKQYCKNKTIREVQACLKMPKRYQTSNFGPITQEYLESRDQNGTLITIETINAVCGANHRLAQDSGSGVKDVGTETPKSETPVASTSPIARNFFINRSKALAKGTPVAGTPVAGTPVAGTPVAGTPASGTTPEVGGEEITVDGTKTDF